LVVGYRAMARWHHARLGSLDADAFLPLIAETHLANEVDLYVARETAAMLTVVARENARLRLYLPASKRVVADVRTEQYLWEIADAFSLRLQHVCLQIARPLLEDWTPALQDALRSLSDAGVTLVITDMEDVSEVPLVAALGFDELHLGPRLAHEAVTNDLARRVVGEMVLLAHDDRLLIAAVGVDEPRQRDLLIEAGCDLAMGNLYGEPRPTDTID
jgi:EAL domain-containing protein (putative c-di-GMP-specific phosphodiesterase class I)